MASETLLTPVVKSTPRPSASPALPSDLKPSALSIDVTNACNLKCKHCFWDSYEHASCMNPNLLNHIKETLDAFPSITNITWYGGEPLLNEKTVSILWEGMKFHQKNNLVITNGTNFIPDFGENIHVGLSLDGIKSINDDIRGQGVYEKAKANALNAIRRGTPMAIIYCVNSMNIDCIPEFVEEWSETPINGVIFTYYAPMKNKHSELIVKDKQKYVLVSMLNELKMRYKKFIYNSPLMIEMLKPKYNKVLAQNCPMNIHNKNGRCHSIHMNHDGSIRKPCALGPYADCFQCRSITKMAIYTGIYKRDKESLDTLFELYHTKKHKARHQTRMQLFN